MVIRIKNGINPKKSLCHCGKIQYRLKKVSVISFGLVCGLFWLSVPLGDCAHAVITRQHAAMIEVMYFIIRFFREAKIHFFKMFSD